MNNKKVIPRVLTAGPSQAELQSVTGVAFIVKECESKRPGYVLLSVNGDPFVLDALTAMILAEALAEAAKRSQKVDR